MKWLFLVLAVVLASPEVVRAAAFPDVALPGVYEGRANHESGTYAFVLQLQRGQGFVLQERVTRNGKTEEQFRTGKWHQIRDNALLELSNLSGFFCSLNVGGTGNLYFGWPLPSAEYLALTLRPERSAVERSFSYPMTGVLYFGKSERAVPSAKAKEEKGKDASSDAADEAVLENRDSSLRHRISGAKVAALREQYRGRPVLVEARVRETDELARGVGESPSLYLEEVSRSTEELPRSVQGTPTLFRDLVAGQLWESGTKARLRYTFIPGSDTRTGMLKLFDGAQEIRVPYALLDAGLAFAQAGLEGLRAAGHEETAAKLAQVCEWRVEGHVLELRSKTHVVDILEKRIF